MHLNVMQPVMFPQHVGKASCEHKKGFFVLVVALVISLIFKWSHIEHVIDNNDRLTGTT